MHLFLATMAPSQSHLWLRIGALALLATAALWPRASRTGHGADGMTAAEVMRGASDSTMAQRTPRAPHGAAARAETTAARLASPPRTVKLVAPEADESQLNN